MEDMNIKRRSICSVLAMDYAGKRYLRRLADIDVEGKITSYEFDAEKPMIFDNRNKIYWKDGPDDEGFIGIWNWTATPNNNSPEKDYIDSKYDPSESPIQIIEILNVYTINELIECIKTGVASIPMSDNVMYAYKIAYGKFESVLCHRKDLEIKNGLARLNSDIASLNVYKFNEDAIYQTKQYEFYKYLSIGKAEYAILVKSYLDIIKDIVLKRASWSVAKQNELSKSDWKLFKEFISNLTDNTIYQEISDACMCSNTDAEKYLEQFINSAETKVIEGDLDISILSKVIEKSNDLRSACEKIVETEWEKKNRDKIQDKIDELRKVSQELVDKIEEKKNIEGKIHEEEKRLASILEDVNAYEAMGNSVKLKVHEKIEEARKDMAEFISQITMYSSFNTSLEGANKNKEVFFETSYFSGEECFEGNVSTYQETLDSVSDELIESGVEVKYVDLFAKFLLAAYSNHVHLLLAGPNSESIVNAFSIGMFGRYADILDCNHSFNFNSIEAFMHSDNDVIMIKNPICAEWRDQVMDLLMSTNKFIILLCPFAEDLLIEPKGLLNYALPIMTETIINEPVKNHFVGKKQNVNYKKYECCKKKPLHDEFLKRINVNNLLIGKIQQILTDLHNLDKNADNTVDYLFALFPYMYVAGLGNVFIEKISTDKNVDKEKADYMIKYFGEIE